MKLEDGTCYECDPGKYSLVMDSDKCNVCPTFCICNGKDHIMVKNGYWRENSLSDSIEECYNNQKNCLGGEGDFTCKEGHIGALCEACDLRKDKWGESWTHVT